MTSATDRSFSCGLEVLLSYKRDMLSHLRSLPSNVEKMGSRAASALIENSLQSFVASDITEFK